MFWEETCRFASPCPKGHADDPPPSEEAAARTLVPVAAFAMVSGTVVQAQAQAQAQAQTRPGNTHRPPQTATFTSYGSRTVPSVDGDVLVRYPTSSGAIAPKRPLALVGHGMGMDPAVALSGHTYLVNAGYVVAVPPLGSSTNYLGLARVVSRSLDAVLADPALAPGILPDRIGYTGGRGRHHRHRAAGPVGARPADRGVRGALGPGLRLVPLLGRCAADALHARHRGHDHCARPDPCRL